MFEGINKWFNERLSDEKISAYKNSEEKFDKLVKKIDEIRKELHEMKIGMGIILEELT